MSWQYKLELVATFGSGAKVSGSTQITFVTDIQLTPTDKSSIPAIFRIVEEREIP